MKASKSRSKSRNSRKYRQLKNYRKYKKGGDRKIRSRKIRSHKVRSRRRSKRRRFLHKKRKSSPFFYRMVKIGGRRRKSMKEPFFYDNVVEFGRDGKRLGWVVLDGRQLGGSSARRNLYKKSFDSEDGRRKRGDTAVQIRRQKRQSKLRKKRSPAFPEYPVAVPDLPGTPTVSAVMSPPPPAFHDAVSGLPGTPTASAVSELSEPVLLLLYGKRNNWWCGLNGSDDFEMAVFNKITSMYWDGVGRGGGKDWLNTEMSEDSDKYSSEELSSVKNCVYTQQGKMALNAAKQFFMEWRKCSLRTI